MAAHCSAKVAAILGGAIRNQTDAVLFQGITKSTTTWRLRFAATLASPIQRSASGFTSSFIRETGMASFIIRGAMPVRYATAQTGGSLTFNLLNPDRRNPTMNPDNPLGRRSGEGRNPAIKDTPRITSDLAGVVCQLSRMASCSISGQNHNVVPLTWVIFNHLDTGLRRYDAVLSNGLFGMNRHHVKGGCQKNRVT